MMNSLDDPLWYSLGDTERLSCLRLVAGEVKGEVFKTSFRLAEEEAIYMAGLLSLGLGDRKVEGEALAFALGRTEEATEGKILWFTLGPVDEEADVGALGLILWLTKQSQKVFVVVDVLILVNLFFTKYYCCFSLELL